ncbi:hypothetical protein Bca52824_074507 [Brassica carinata]|uniref:Alpha/beta hydrolase fold-3 domain-containing protein n=1 Tax=Brassica carinata TaxID=52824 RepID=A0A8X7PR76_BRACI|nr:hypothetical protein Bca52824_074507 [Brassica carinata]
MLRRTVFTSSLRSHPLFIRHFIPSYQSLPFPTTAVIIAGRHYLRRLSTPTDTTIRCISSQTASDLVSKHPPFVRIYKDGRVERLAGTETIPASLTPQNGVVSKDAVYSPEHNLSLSLLIYIHGGAWLIGSPFSPIYHNFLTEVVKTANCLAVSIQYRLAQNQSGGRRGFRESNKKIYFHLLSSRFYGPVDWINKHADFNRVFLSETAPAETWPITWPLEPARRSLTQESKGLRSCIQIFRGKNRSTSLICKTEKRVAEVWEKLVSPNSVDGADELWFNAVGSGSDFSGLGCEKVLVAVAGRDVFVRQGLGYAEKLKKSGWRGDVEVMEEEDEDHCFHLLNPCSENASRFMTKFVEFITG